MVRDESGLDRLGISSIVAFGVMVVLSVALGRFVAGRVLRPLRTITDKARDISTSNLHARLDLEGPDDEITELGATLDDLFARLEASFESQRRFVANASHELRTPLTVQRAVLQVALTDPDASVATLRSACDEVLTSGAQQERLIDALLTLASSERGVERWEPVDLADVAARVVHARRDAFDAAGIQVETSFGAARTSGDPTLVASLVANLVDNALHHTRPADGGPARVDIATTTSADGPCLAVRNTGAVIAPADVARLVQPFQRLGDARVDHAGGGGVGLGLAIVKAIADGHGATLHARPRVEGGLDVEVLFGAPRPV